MAGSDTPFPLDDDQRLAITHDAGDLLVVGPPGSGKTHVLTARATWLIATDRVSPERLLILTSSRRAADALLATLRGTIRGGLLNRLVLSLPALCRDLVTQHFRLLGYRRPPEPLSWFAQTAFIRTLLAQERAPDWAPYDRSLGRPGFVRALQDFLTLAHQCISRWPAASPGRSSSSASPPARSLLWPTRPIPSSGRCSIGCG